MCVNVCLCVKVTTRRGFNGFQQQSEAKGETLCCCIRLVYANEENTICMCVRERETARSAGKLMSLLLPFSLRLTRCLISVFLYENMHNDLHMHTFISLKNY